MKESLKSLLRHALTGLAAVTGYLAAKNLIEPGDAGAVNEAFGNLIEPLATILSAVAARLLLMALAKFNLSSLVSKTPGWVLVVCTGGSMAAVLGLSSCSDSGYPLTGSITYRDPGSGAKAGLVFEPGAAPRASIRYPVYDKQTGELIGLADLQGAPAVDRSSAK